MLPLILCGALSLAHLGAPAPPASTSTSIGFLPRGLTSFGATVDGGWLYVLGGYFGEPHAYSIEGQSSAFMRINLHDTRDVRLLGDVEPVQGAELVSWNGQLVSVGGMHARNTSDEPSYLESSSSVALYDPIAEAWSELPPMPEPRSSHRAVVIEDTLYVVGGWTMAGTSKGANWATTTLTLDLADPTPGWESSVAPFIARALGAASAGSHLYAIGGIAKGRDISSAVWVLDTETAEWTQGPDFPDWGFGVSATAHGAGIVASGKSGTVYSLTPGDTDWIPTGDLAHGRIFHELRSESEDSLVALGGIAGMGVHGRVRAIERLSLAADESPRIERTVIPAPMAARNRFGLMVAGRSAYLFGGNNSLGQHDFEPENFVSEAWRLDFGSLAWTPLTALPIPRQTIQSSTSEDGSLGFAVGGFGHNGEDAVTQSSSLIYDFEFDDWSEGPSLIGSRSQFGLARRGKSLWVFGGLDYDPSRPKGEAFDHRTDILRWDGESESFEATEHVLPEGRRAFAGAVHGDRYYLFGGMADGFQPVTQSRAFDFTTQEWLDVPSPAQGRVGADLVPIGNQLLLGGGSSPRSTGKGLTPNHSVESYSPITNEWTTLVEDIDMDMKHARAFELDGKLCILTLHREGPGRVELVRVEIPPAPEPAVSPAGHSQH